MVLRGREKERRKKGRGVQAQGREAYIMVVLSSAIHNV